MRILTIIFFFSFLSQVEAQSVYHTDNGIEINSSEIVNSSQVFNNTRTLFFGVYVDIDYSKKKVLINKKEFDLLKVTPITNGEILSVNGGKLTILFNPKEQTVETLFVEGINVKGLKCEYIGVKQ